ncbi:hypothetical protein [Archaeoglobus profundus]|uniref:Uncharacterized protein n=1 Tax=Archaeoglobus profundus (strain DSM 5631 / JCM 9629 / NBRC 100127 / Av18) TaxID=572546 RepID=D2RF16_ARCPA|nr:hypothetical protein [Archaeoglobus profundus]ADB58710.1 hypothetical protein Arcpr_1664 [Archaeoglobus profundus DSM 5631]
MNDGDYYGEWLHRGCGGNLIILIDAGKKTVEGKEIEGLVFKLKCTKCPYESEFAFLGFEGLEEEGDEE